MSVYTNLQNPSGKQMIRLLALLPKAMGDQLQCTLKPAALEDSLRYEALSYCWGPKSPECGLLCNGINITIFPNLYSALMHLRKEIEPRLLWIDAVCINQSDPGEKSLQIPLMREIYGKAQHTIIWLGASSPLADLALQHTPNFLQMKEELDEIKDDRYYNRLGPKDWERYNLPDPVHDRSRWSFYWAVSEMWLSPWFSRVWVIQEHAVSKQCQVRFGKNQLPLEHLISLYEIFSSLNLLDPRVPLATMRTIRNLREIRNAYMKGEKRQLIDWLKTEAPLTEATDPRDKIFALCGIASDVCDGKFVVEIDYQKETAKVYLDFAISYITTYRNTALLEVPSWGYNSDIAGLPSWCPDWSVHVPGLMPLRPPGSDGRLYNYNCAPNSSQSPSIDNSDHELRVNAIKISEIGAVSPIDDIPGGHGLGKQVQPEHVFARARLAAQWADNCGLHTHPTYVTGEKALDCLAFTITAGIYRNQSVIELFTLWWKLMKTIHKGNRLDPECTIIFENRNRFGGRHLLCIDE